MNRRNFSRWLSGFIAINKWKVLGAPSQQASFPGAYGQALRKVAAVVLPSELSEEQRSRVAVNFEQYVRDYRPGADTEHGYGVTRVRPKPPSPVEIYLGQLQMLPSDVTAEAIARVIESSQIKELPQTPNGKNVVVDLLAFYFRSSDANDLCYRAAIRRDKCRGLAGSANVPPSLKRPA